jgi:serine/threonine protein kinase
LSGYRVERELGRGGMAVVYEAWHEDLERRIALKVLAAHLAGNDEFRKRFLREARIAARLSHANLVRTYDIDEHEGLPSIVMEFLPGGTLEGGSLTREEAACIASALAYAHAQGVVHRDLKPANILRDAEGAPKIVDFGIARAAEETMLTQAGTVLGTLRYLSPEQAAGRVVGPPADVYSLGVVLDELLAGRTAADNALLDRCRANDPELRPTAADVAAALDGDTLVAPTRIVARHHARSWRRIAFVAAAVAAAAVALAVATFSGGGGTTVEPVPHGTSAAQQAQNLGVWLEKYSR